MHLPAAVLGIVGVPLLSGCMLMGGWGHTAGLGASMAGHTVSRQTVGSLQRSEASSGGITITLSFPTPTIGSVVAISALLRSEGGDREPADGEVWLRVQTPSGIVDQLRMQRPAGIADGTHQTRYSFSTPGLYVVTADARSGTGAEVHAVSVTIEVEPAARRPQRDG
jgi:hypothetical protein